MELKDLMETSMCYLSLSREKQQYVAGLIKGFSLASNLKEESEMEEKNNETH